MGALNLSHTSSFPVKLPPWLFFIRFFFATPENTAALAFGFSVFSFFFPRLSLKLFAEIVPDYDFFKSPLEMSEPLELFASSEGGV